MAQTCNPNIPAVFYNMAVIAVETTDEWEHSYSLQDTGNAIHASVEYHNIERLQELINHVALEMYKAFLYSVEAL